MLPILDKFIDDYGAKVYRKNLNRNFTLHLSSLHEFGILSSLSVLQVTTKMQKLIKAMLEHPEDYPDTPEQVPIDNPYYIPKPVHPTMNKESFTLHLSDSDELQQQEKQQVKKTTKKITKQNNLTAAESGLKKGKSFWLKKCFRNPVVTSKNNDNTKQNDVVHDDAKWPRKKAVVTFANEIFVDMINDVNDNNVNKSRSRFSDHSSSYLTSDHILYKHSISAIISPRQRRGNS
jgi:hypothetical protein